MTGLEIFLMIVILCAAAFVTGVFTGVIVGKEWAGNEKRRALLDTLVG